MHACFIRTGATALGCFLLFLAACTPSLQPFYTEKDLITEPALAGVFAEDANKPTWTFTRGGDQAYSLVIKDGEKSSRFVAHLFRLGDHRYLDVYASADALDDCPREDFLKASLVPGHLVFKVPRIGSDLQLQALDESWLKENLGSKITVPHMLIENGRLVFTGSTGQMQEFLRQIAAGKAWGEPAAFKRRT